MKVFFYSFLFFAPMLLTAQEPPKKSTKVIVAVRDVDNSKYRELCRLLFEKGYSFETRDSALKIIETNPLPSKKWGTISKVKAIFNDSTIIFTNRIALEHEIELFNEGQPTVKNYMQVSYIGSKKSAMREAWNEMVEIAKQFGQVTYSK